MEIVIDSINSGVSHLICVLDVAEESLEEISLKLIKSFLQEKTELEEQYAQVILCCENYISVLI